MSPVEMIARAMAKAHHGSEFTHYPHLYEEMARAALTALETPSEGMMNAGHSAFSTCSAAWPDAAGVIFRRMIRAALEEQE